jgi:hypothetical protein
VADIDIEGENGGPRMYMPPLLPPLQCESKLITRADDTEKVVKERLRVYHDLVRSSGLRLFFFPFFFYLCHLTTPLVLVQCTGDWF